MTSTTTHNSITSSWFIEAGVPHPVVQYAARELQDMLARMGCPALHIVQKESASFSPTAQRFALTCGNDGDGFTRSPDAHGITLHGDGPRGVLYAVYDLLESLGCRWIAPGAAGEYIPTYDTITIPLKKVRQQPGLPGRCIVIGHDIFLNDAEEWIIWAARNRFNTLFVHTTHTRIAPSACHLSRWHEVYKHIVPLLQERGMVLELGGHSFSTLVPRSHIRTTPEAFRDNGTKRTNDYNFCPSSFHGRQLLRNYGAAFFRTYPETTVFHLWQDDIPGGGWCSCPRCSRLSPSDQALMAINELAETLNAINPQARISYLAYHDTIAPPSKVEPHPNIMFVFAPRSRSYAHSIGESACADNVLYAQHLADMLSFFRQYPRNRQQHRVLEYYLDGILFKSSPPPLYQVIARDMRFYQSAGVHTVQLLLTGDRPWVATPMNGYFFAQCAWNPLCDEQAVLATYAATQIAITHTTNEATAPLVHAYHALHDAWHLALQHLPNEHTMPLSSATPHTLRDFVAEPVVDMLDYMASPVHVREQRLRLLAPMEKLLDDGWQAWHQVFAIAGTPILRHEQAEWQLAALLLRFIELRQQLYMRETQHSDPVHLNDALDEAQHTLDEMLAWANTYLAPTHRRAYHRLMRLMLQLHLDAVADRTHATQWQRIWLRTRMLMHITWSLLHIVVQ